MRCLPSILSAQIGWQQEIHVGWEAKFRRKHADNRVHCTINLQARLREVPRRSEILSPVSIADKNGGAGPFFRVAGGEIPPQDRLNLGDPWKLGRDPWRHRARPVRSPLD